MSLVLNEISHNTSAVDWLLYRYKHMQEGLKMRKSNIKQLLRQSMDAPGSMITNSADYDPLFQLYERNLYKTHSVPKIKIHQPRFW